MIKQLLKRNKKLPIGLDIGNHSIKMVQLGENKNKLQVLSAEERLIPHDLKDETEKKKQFIKEAIEDMIETGDFQGNEVITCINNDRLNMTSIKLSNINEEDIQDVIKREAEQKFGINPENGVVEYLEAGNVKFGEDIKGEYIIFAADNDSLSEIIELIDESGLDIKSIDTIPCAIYRSFRQYLRRKEDWQKATVFIDLGSKYTTVVFGMEGGICFAKQVPVGGNDFNGEIAKKLNVSMSDAQILREKVKALNSENPENKNEEYFIDSTVRQSVVDAVSAVSERLVKEVSHCLRYYTVTFRGKRVERAIFTGGESYEKILLNTFKRHMTIDIEIANPFRGLDLRNVNISPDRRKNLCEWSVAVGLGLKGYKFLRMN